MSVRLTHTGLRRCARNSVFLVPRTHGYTCVCVYEFWLGYSAIAIFLRDLSTSSNLASKTSGQISLSRAYYSRILVLLQQRLLFPSNDQRIGLLSSPYRWNRKRVFIESRKRRRKKKKEGKKKEGKKARETRVASAFSLLEHIHIAGIRTTIFSPPTWAERKPYPSASPLSLRTLELTHFRPFTYSPRSPWRTRLHESCRRGGGDSVICAESAAALQVSRGSAG